MPVSPPPMRPSFRPSRVHVAALLCVAAMVGWHVAAGRPLDLDECGVLGTCTGRLDRPAFRSDPLVALAEATFRAFAARRPGVVEAALLAVSAVCGFLTLVATGRIASRVAPAPADVVAPIVLTAWTAFSVQVAGIRLIYAPSLAAGTWALVHWLEWIDRPARPPGAPDADRSGAFVRFALLGTAALAGHRIAATLVPIGVVAGPLLGARAADLRARGPLLAFGAWAATAAALFVAWPHVHAGAKLDAVRTPASLVFGVGAVALLAPLAFGPAACAALRRPRHDAITALTAFAAAHVVVVTFTLSVLAPRYYLHIAPVLAVLVVCGVDSVFRCLRRREFARAAALVAAGAAATGGEFFVRDRLGPRGGPGGWAERATGPLGHRLGFRGRSDAAALAQAARTAGGFDVWVSDMPLLTAHYFGGGGGRLDAGMETFDVESAIRELELRIGDAVRTLSTPQPSVRVAIHLARARNHVGRDAAERFAARRGGALLTATRGRERVWVVVVPR